MRTAAIYFLLLGAIVLAIAAGMLFERHGLFAALVFLVYAAGALSVELTLRRRRELGLFLAGGFVVGCGAGCFMSLGQFLFFDTLLGHLAAALAFGFGGLGCTLSALAGCKESVEGGIS